MKDPHKYEYAIDLDSGPHRVVRLVGRQRKVLELGSGPGTITKELSANECLVTALDIDSTAIEKVKPHCEAVYQCDFNDPGWPATLPPMGTFDVLVAADVFEHLNDPWGCLEKLHQFLGVDGSLIVSLPHVGHAAVMACLINSDLDYQRSGLLDKTHIRFFGLKNMQALFENAGFKIVEAEFVVVPPKYTELDHQWLKVPEQIQTSLLSGAFSTIYQVVLRVVPASFSGQALNLVSLHVPEPHPISLKKKIRRKLVRSRFLSLISPQVRLKIKRYFNVLH